MYRSQTAVAIALTVLFATAAPAELYRCTGPGGKTIFTDQKDVCPGAEAFEPDGVVHTAPTPAKHPPAAIRQNRIMSEIGAKAGAEEWQDKKREAEARLQQIQQQRDWMKPYVTHCNRGGYITTHDAAGIEEVVNCSVLKKDFAALDDEEAEAREYLEEGLPEACRKAGCEPGWLR
jgi:hypothetical protein